MNAAYRYWRRIDWRPTYYCCLDDALIDTHKGAILDLIAEKRIKRFFLSGRIVEFHPELKDNPDVFFLDQFVEHWFRVRGEKLGLSFIDHPAFKTNDPDMLTTGAYSVRFGVFLGHDLIRFLGIDLTYVPLQQVRHVERGRLEVTRTPTQNPNYFFDEYQVEGDQFHIANPEQHGRNLHLHSFISVRNDFVRNDVGVRLLNAAQESRLFEDAIIRYESLSTDELVTLPVTRLRLALDWGTSSMDRLSNVLALWGLPAFFPLLKRDLVADLLIVLETAASSLTQDKIRKQIEDNAPLRDCFEDIRFASRDVARCDPTASAKADFLGDRDDEVRITLDANCLPMTNDWLGALATTPDLSCSMLELPNALAPPSDIARARRGAPEAVILKAPALARLFDDHKSTDLPASLRELITGDPEQWSAKTTSQPTETTSISVMRSILRRFR